MLDGAPDPTFGMLPDEKSTWDISLQKMEKKLVTELDEVYVSGVVCHSKFVLLNTSKIVGFKKKILSCFLF